jgi:hypothetical protein
MPGFLLHLGATVTCAHTGQAQPLSSDPRVLVSGQPIVTQPVPWAITTVCTMPPPSAGGNGPCVTAQFVSAATRVLAGGLPVLLSDSQAICTPTGTPLAVVVTQPRASGM